ncbi:hypothetical protein MEBOL_006154 [Melittangium boletus DSM 14713]|uniref:Tyr recombinase domain-containing protein n=1 Tax=Melittangium boletus DSM 14713 TaxID=1294270 RepID=A0A250ILN5_9BACT|nr:hypothetical protein MEBOL_006154 [Melittangium boletus DSM 14713]
MKGVDGQDGGHRTWDGGFIRKDERGRDVYVIRRQLHGKRYVVSTRAHSLRAALQHLARFEADPEGYRPSGEPHEAPIYLDEALALEFLTWSRDVQKNTPKWVGEQRLYLGWWGDRLARVDLRRASLRDHILPALQGATARGPRIAVLKRLYSYLRKVKHVLSSEEDPTQELMVPQARPEQWTRVKAIPREDFLRVRDHLTGSWRDGMDVLAGTGWHVTELVRFVRAGVIELLPESLEGVAGVLICPRTKGGELLRTPVSSAVMEAAERLRERGTFSAQKFAMAIKAACRAAGVEEFGPGQFRHSVATWAVNKGASLAAVADFLNHKSPRTTAKFYAVHATPTKVPTLL